MHSRKTLGMVSVVVAVLAVVVTLLVALFVPATKEWLWRNGPYVIWALEAVALVLGIIAWRTREGKIGAITSIVLSLVLAAYLTFDVVSVQ